MPTADKTERARRIREAANAFDSDIARTLIELAEELEAEAAAEQPRQEEPIIRAS